VNLCTPLQGNSLWKFEKHSPLRCIYGFAYGLQFSPGLKGLQPRAPKAEGPPKPRQKNQPTTTWRNVLPSWWPLILLTSKSLVNEFLQFIALIRDGDRVTGVAHMNGLLRAHGGMLLSTFPNVGIALMLYLTLPVTNFHQKSFSTLARIKNHLRASMGQTRLSALSLMCIESNTPEIIKYF